MSTSVSPRSRPRLPRLVAAVSAAALTLGAALVAAGPASADSTTVTVGSGVNAGQVTYDNKPTYGKKIHLEGANFFNGDKSGGSTIGVKLDSGSTEPSASAGGPVTNPSTGQSADALNIWYAIQANADGTFSADVPFPTGDNASDGTNWAVASTHHLRLLTGSMQSGDNPRSGQLDLTVAPKPVNPTVTSSVATAATNVVTVTLGGQAFTPGETLRVGQDGRALKWTTGGGRGGAATVVSDTLTVGSDGTFASARVVFDAGTLRAGAHQLTVTRQGGDTVAVPYTVNPYIAFSSLALGTSGTLTLSDLPSGANISSVKLGTRELLAAPTSASDAGTVTAGYSIPADGERGTLPVSITQSSPVSQTYTSSAKVSPSTAALNEDGYDRVSTDKGAIQQGLYQSAYSAKSDALFATSANVTTTSTIYKLDPETLAVKASVVPAYVSGNSGALWAAYGIGVDDVNGTVWVTNTRQNSVAVYSQDDLHLIKQFPADTTSHARDVVADPATGQVFVSSASEGSTGDGYISVFESGDKDGDGQSYEFIRNIATHARTEFSPVSLELDAKNHKLFSVSLTSQRALVVDTQSLVDNYIELPDLQAGGRGASGVAYDPVTNRLFVASQNSDELLIAQLNASLTTGTLVKEVPTGAGALNVAFEPVHRLAYVANLSGGTVTAVDPNGKVVANLPFPRANHVAEDGLGSVFAVNKDADNQVTKLTAKASAQPTPQPTPEPTPQPAPVVQGGTVTVAGAVQVGQRVAAKTTGWSGATSYSYQWKHNGVAITGARSSTYVATAADLHKRLSVTVTGSSAGATPASVTSGSTAPVAGGRLSATKPRIVGKAKVGARLVVSPGRWTSGSRLTYRWYADGRPVAGAVRTAYVPQKAQKGDRISVVVTGAKPGYYTLRQASAPTAKVAKR